MEDGDTPKRIHKQRTSTLEQKQEKEKHRGYYIIILTAREATSAFSVLSARLPSGWEALTESK